MGSTCTRCGGRKHVRDPERPGVWKPCDCLAADQTIAAMRKAGVPERHTPWTFKRFFTEWTMPPSSLGVAVALAKALKEEGQVDRSLVVHGPREGRELLASLFVRYACTGHRTAAIADLPRLIDVEFKRDDESAVGIGQRIYTVGLLVLRLGGEPAHRYNRVVLEKAMKARWGGVLPTVLVVDGDPSRIATDYRSREVDEIVGKYRRIQVEKKFAAPQTRGTS